MYNECVATFTKAKVGVLFHHCLNVEARREKACWIMGSQSQLVFVIEVLMQPPSAPLKKPETLLSLLSSARTNPPLRIHHRQYVIIPCTVFIVQFVAEHLSEIWRSRSCFTWQSFHRLHTGDELQGLELWKQVEPGDYSWQSVNTAQGPYNRLHL